MLLTAVQSVADPNISRDLRPQLSMRAMSLHAHFKFNQKKGNS